MSGDQSTSNMQVYSADSTNKESVGASVVPENSLQMDSEGLAAVAATVEAQRISEVEPVQNETRGIEIRPVIGATGEIFSTQKIQQSRQLQQLRSELKGMDSSRNAEPSFAAAIQPLQESSVPAIERMGKLIQNALPGSEFDPATLFEERQQERPVQQSSEPIIVEIAKEKNEVTLISQATRTESRIEELLRIAREEGQRSAQAKAEVTPVAAEPQPEAISAPSPVKKLLSFLSGRPENVATVKFQERQAKMASVRKLTRAA